VPAGGRPIWWICRQKDHGSAYARVSNPVIGGLLLIAVGGGWRRGTDRRCGDAGFKFALIVRGGGFARLACAKSEAAELIVGAARAYDWARRFAKGEAMCQTQPQLELTISDLST